MQSLVTDFRFGVPYNPDPDAANQLPVRATGDGQSEKCSSPAAMVRDYLHQDAVR